MQNNEAAATGRTNLWQKLLPAVMALCIVGAWLQWRALASVRSNYEASRHQLASMKSDAAQILKLREAPQSAVGQARTSQELLHQVEKALGKANIDRSLWSDSVPQLPVRVPDTDYQRAGVRLYFTALTMQQIATFAHQLREDDPTLSVSAVNLTNRDQETPNFDMDVMVSYLLYSPASTSVRTDP